MARRRQPTRSAAAAKSHGAEMVCWPASRKALRPAMGRKEAMRWGGERVSGGVPSAAVVGVVVG
jgi:hypothetical protein